MSYKNSVKRHNHKVHTCEVSRKQNLLKHLIDVYEDKKVLVLSKANSKTTEIEDKNLTLSNDTELCNFKEGSFDVLISFDLPADADTYMKRIAYTSTMALILVSVEEEALLYPIETLLGKNLPREVVPGFEVLRSNKTKNPPHRPTKSQVAEEEAAKERVREKQARLRERAEKRGEEVSAEDLKKIEDDETKYLKDSKADKKEQKNGNNNFGKKEWDKKSTDYRGKNDSSTKRKPKIIVLPAKKATK
ncbi:hypothetical protein JHD50_10800 [Sulfurimonas sp. MAG313]|nr:hypothetical protein [Sulfurimonas sp. MAG313]MDF1881780.1 hypothetical protein [Sulfurimonas sp. MAG313]